jgi:superfamily II DNA or RNA helicase
MLFGMKLRQDLLQGIERFLDLVPAVTRKRGRGYFFGGAVLALECVAADRRYEAVVRGGADYQVSLQFEDRFWSADCSCPMQYDCKHAVAAMLELQKRALEDGETAKDSPIAFPANGRLHKAPPPDSALHARLKAQLGRELSSMESGYLKVVTALYSMAQIRSLTDNDLAPLSRGLRLYGWQPLELWPESPADDFYLWLYLAWEFRRRKLSWPKFLDGITDFSLIGAAMGKWESRREIERWGNWFRGFRSPAPASASGRLELRLAVLPQGARLEWRTEPGAPFAEMKQRQAKIFAERFDKGGLEIQFDSLALWSAAFKPWHYESWWSFDYSSDTARPVLNRLLRMPLPPERLVAADGQPLRRWSEPLRLSLRPPEKAKTNYLLALATAEGAPPPRILCTLEGEPTLYLTDNGLFHGPPANALGGETVKAIPAPALETSEGVRFLHAVGIPLPEHLAGSVCTVPVAITVSCGVQPVYPGSAAENIVVDISAKAPGMKVEKFTVNGWESPPEERSGKLKGGKGVITVHDRAAQALFPRLLDPLGLKWGGYPGNWAARLTKKTPELFVSWLKSLPPEIAVMLDRELASLRDEPVSGSVSLDVQESAMDWFDLKVVLNVGDEKLTPEELKLLLNARGGYVRLGRKGWRRLQFNLTPEEDEQLARLGLNARDFSAEPQRFHALQLADDAARKFLAPDRVEKIQRRVSELKVRVSPTLPPAIRANMRPYQTEGFHFLAYLTSNRFGGVLADDMGLGKTLQSLAWLAWLAASAGARTAARRPSLVVCPKSVMDNWRTEGERFYPDLRVRLWRGEPAEELPAACANADLVILNYTQLRSLSPAIGETPWMAAILDEAQYIKNPDSQTAQAARALKAEYRLALTGTPIENRLLDLWSIFSFAMPGALGNRAHFLRRFNAQDDPLARRRLAARVRPFLLRRNKAQVAKDLPDRVEEDLLCEMEGRQRTLYRAELKRARQLLLGLKTNKEFNDARFNVLTSLLRLRQICCHPALVDGKLRDEESAKMAALEDLLEPLMEEGHKVLVFSQFVTMLDLLRDRVTQRQWPHFYLAGDTENRGELVKEFQASAGAAVFLISLKAGGFGLNLTAASYVVLFDPWWNPAVENQAIDRTHRIGQTSKVMAYRLLTADSIEQKIRALQKKKASLANDVFGEERFAQSLSLEDLRFLFSD